MSNDSKKKAEAHNDNKYWDSSQSELTEANLKIEFGSLKTNGMAGANTEYATDFEMKTLIQEPAKMDLRVDSGTPQAPIVMREIYNLYTFLKFIAENTYRLETDNIGTLRLLDATLATYLTGNPQKIKKMNATAIQLWFMSPTLFGFLCKAEQVAPIAIVSTENEFARDMSWKYTLCSELATENKGLKVDVEDEDPKKAADMITMQKTVIRSRIIYIQLLLQFYKSIKSALKIANLDFNTLSAEEKYFVANRYLLHKDIEYVAYRKTTLTALQQLSMEILKSDVCSVAMLEAQVIASSHKLLEHKKFVDTRYFGEMLKSINLMYVTMLDEQTALSAPHIITMLIMNNGINVIPPPKVSLGRPQAQQGGPVVVSSANAVNQWGRAGGGGSTQTNYPHHSYHAKAKEYEPQTQKQQQIIIGGDGSLLSYLPSYSSSTVSTRERLPVDSPYTLTRRQQQQQPFQNTQYLTHAGGHGTHQQTQKQQNKKWVPASSATITPTTTTGGSSSSRNVMSLALHGKQNK